ncbi:TIGR02466 family protein [Sedimentitalea nanhaiensis]|uniref:2OG-Fe(II) oxygenase n=1 Tax=Sedimentitalea nanhaiensis TaxID=999627 RepID=A0A1I7EB50_9RHOB|nr:TIGR02466 family protein [Sedimentitalea nanhaiensis]SFU21083.1 conserved hypothetical protein [Sedimentitalea nanhaiensis]
MDTLEQTDCEELFSTPLFRFRLPDADAFNRDLLQEGVRLRKQSEGVAKSNYGAWHSSGDLFESTTTCIMQLKTVAEAATYIATQNVSPDLDLATLKLDIFGWMNSTPSGGFNAPHTHPGAHWSGVYYVSQPAVEKGESGKIEFLNPRTDLPNWRILKSPTFGAARKFRPQPGELVLFPSYLVHWVYPNETQEERVSIAFNATFRTTGSKK